VFTAFTMINLANKKGLAHKILANTGLKSKIKMLNASRCLSTMICIRSGSRLISNLSRNSQLRSKSVSQKYFIGNQSVRFQSAESATAGDFVKANSSPRQILGLNPGEHDPKQIKTAYFKKARQFHPDTHANLNIDPAEVEFRRAQFILVTKAYEALLVEPDLYSLLGLEKDINLDSSANLNQMMNHYAQRLQMLQGDFKMKDRESRIHDLQYAFDILSNPELRRKYNDGFTDLRKELQEIAKEHNINLKMDVPKMGTKGYILYYIQWFGMASLVVGLAFWLDGVRNFGVQNSDRYNILTEADFEKKSEEDGAVNV
jgi:hypothetical protein